MTDGQGHRIGLDQRLHDVGAVQVVAPSLKVPAGQKIVSHGLIAGKRHRATRWYPGLVSVSKTAGDRIEKRLLKSEAALSRRGHDVVVSAPLHV